MMKARNINVTFHVDVHDDKTWFLLPEIDSCIV
jgi:hypothetical protein